MSSVHASDEQCAVPPLKWTIKNKLKQFVHSGRQLITFKGGGLGEESQKQPGGRLMTFSLYAPAAGYVSLAGDFNAWSPDDYPLEKTSDGLWERVVSLPPGRYEYKFVVDGLWLNDPRCAVYTPNPFGGENCVVILS